MARRDRRHPDGVAGDWFVDDRCIACGACYSIAPDLIRPTSDGRQLVFVRQPSTADDVLLAQLAAEVCPTQSVGTGSGQRWPRHHPVEVAPGVWRTGSNSPDTAGGNAFIVERPSGNLLVDAPRDSPTVRREIAARGGLAAILLTHRDDVGDADRYATAFDAEVVIHAADADAAPYADRLLGDAEVEVVDGVLAIPTPGHTEGHVMYLVDGVLFSGDSLGWDADRGDLWAERFVCWSSWPAQLDSLERLARHRFTQVVPTHGGISPVFDPDAMRTRLHRLVAELRAA